MFCSSDCSQLSQEFCETLDCSKIADSSLVITLIARLSLTSDWTHTVLSATVAILTPRDHFLPGFINWLTTLLTANSQTDQRTFVLFHPYFRSRIFTKVHAGIALCLFWHKDHPDQKKIFQTIWRYLKMLKIKILLILTAIHKHTLRPHTYIHIYIYIYIWMHIIEPQLKCQWRHYIKVKCKWNAFIKN